MPSASAEHGAAGGMAGNTTANPSNSVLYDTDGMRKSDRCNLPSEVRQYCVGRRLAWLTEEARDYLCPRRAPDGVEFPQYHMAGRSAER